MITYAIMSDVRCHGCAAVVPKGSAYSFSPVRQSGLRERSCGVCDPAVKDAPPRSVPESPSALSPERMRLIVSGHADDEPDVEPDAAEPVLKRRQVTARAKPTGRTRFVVEARGDGSVRVSIDGQDGTAETITAASIAKGLMKTCYAYTDRHIGPRQRVGNKGGSLYNKVRAAVGAWKPVKKKLKRRRL